MPILTTLFLSLLLIKPASAKDEWKGCEDAIEYIPQRMIEIVMAMDSAEREELIKMNTSIDVKAGMACPDDVSYRDMPPSLQRKISEKAEQYEISLPLNTWSQLKCSEALRVYLTEFQVLSDSKVNSTKRTKLIGARESIQNEIAELKAQLKKRKRLK